MKKFITVILALGLLLSLAGCGAVNDLELPPLPDIEAIKAEEAAEAEAAAAAQAAAAEALMEPEVLPTDSPQLANHVIVKVEPYAELHMDPQNGTEPILEFAYDNVAVYVEGRDDVSAAINEHLAAIKETYQTGNDYGYGGATGLNLLLEMATDNYSYIVNSGEEELSMLFASQQSARVARADERVLSLVYNTYEFTGGAHGNYIDRAYVFDTETGERVSLDMLSDDPEALKAFIVEYMLSLYELDENGYYSARIVEDNLLEITVEEAIAALLREGSWYLNDKGLVVFSDIYELGPYAAGICEFVVPYAELADRIEGKWLPTEKSGGGSFVLKEQSEIEDGSEQIIDLVSLDPEGVQLCLAAEGIVYDIRLSRVSYMDKFYETAQLWACSYMNDCLLQLQIGIPEGMPDLMLSYTDGDGDRHSLIFTQSGDDGSFILADDDIEAVG